MAFINWDETLSVKINSIDNEHKKLIELINDFYENVKNRSNNEIISNLIREMKEYTLYHFKTEERYMIQFNYDAYDDHKREHDLFVSKVADLEERFNNGKAIISFEITSFLKDWLKEHIKGTDQKYIEFFLKNGVI